MTEMDDLARDLLARPLLGFLAFTGLDGGPRAVPVWFVHDEDAGEVRLATQARSYKARSLAEHPRAALTVATPSPPYRMAQVTGQITVEPLEGDARLAFRRAMAVRYLGEQAGARYRDERPGEARLLRLRPERVTALDLAGI